MIVMISPTEKARRKREKEEEKRRKAGVVSREEYEGTAAWRREQARRMSSEGQTRGQIVEALGISIHSVNSYLYR